MMPISVLTRLNMCFIYIGITYGWRHVTFAAGKAFILRSEITNHKGRDNER